MSHIIIHIFELRHNLIFACAITAQLIIAFVFATLYIRNPNSEASIHLLWLHSQVCVRPGRNPEDVAYLRKYGLSDNPRLCAVLLCCSCFKKKKLP